MRTVFDAACNLIARAIVGLVWLYDAAREAIDIGGHWARVTGDDE